MTQVLTYKFISTPNISSSGQQLFICLAVGVFPLDMICSHHLCLHWKYLYLEKRISILRRVPGACYLKVEVLSKHLYFVVKTEVHSSKST